MSNPGDKDRRVDQLLKVIVNMQEMRLRSSGDTSVLDTKIVELTDQLTKLMKASESEMCDTDNARDATRRVARTQSESAGGKVLVEEKKSEDPEAAGQDRKHRDRAHMSARTNPEAASAFGGEESGQRPGDSGGACSRRPTGQQASALRSAGAGADAQGAACRTADRRRGPLKDSLYDDEDPRTAASSRRAAAALNAADQLLRQELRRHSHRLDEEERQRADVETRRKQFDPYCSFEECRLSQQGFAEQFREVQEIREQHFYEATLQQAREEKFKYMELEKLIVDNEKERAIDSRMREIYRNYFHKDLELQKMSEEEREKAKKKEEEYQRVKDEVKSRSTSDRLASLINATRQENEREAKRRFRLLRDVKEALEEDWEEWQQKEEKRRYADFMKKVDARQENRREFQPRWPRGQRQVRQPQHAADTELSDSEQQQPPNTDSEAGDNAQRLTSETRQRWTTDPEVSESARATQQPPDVHPEAGGSAQTSQQPPNTQSEADNTVQRVGSETEQPQQVDGREHQLGSSAPTTSETEHATAEGATRGFKTSSQLREMKVPRDALDYGWARYASMSTEEISNLDMREVSTVHYELNYKRSSEISDRTRLVNRRNFWKLRAAEDMFVKFLQNERAHKQFVRARDRKTELHRQQLLERDQQFRQQQLRRQQFQEEEEETWDSE